MSEAGQPGAATPGEHGDGPGQQDDLSRPADEWAPPAAGWPRPGDPAGRQPATHWPPDPASGWAASSPRHGDLPAPVPGLTGDPEPPARVNGHHANGVNHPAEEPSAGRLSPVSAPPDLSGDERRERGGERLAVPAQRPAPAVEQTRGGAEPDPARHASDEPPAGAPSWSDPRPPTSAPPAVQIPPVGTSPSGFEVPPGFHAPIVDRSGPGEQPAEPRGWAEASPPAGEPGPAQPWGPAEPAASGEPPSEPDWSGPSWNRPSWGNAWAPPWSRPGEEPAGRRSRESDPPPGRRFRDGEEPPHADEADEPVGRRSRETEEPAGRRARGEGTPAWAAEPQRPYEPVRAEPSHPYEPVRAEPGRAYEVRRAEPEPAAEAEGPATGDRHAWAAGGPPLLPAGGPEPTPSPVPVERPSWAAERRTSEGTGAQPERPSWAASGASDGPGQAERPFRAPGTPDAAGQPERPSWANRGATGAEPTAPGGASTPGGGRPVPVPGGDRPSWAGGPSRGQSAGPDRPSWASGDPGAAAGHPRPAASDRPSWASGVPDPTAGDPDGSRPTASDRPSWASAGPTGAPSALPDATTDDPDVAARPTAQPFRLRPETPEREAESRPTAGGRRAAVPGADTTDEPTTPTGPAPASVTSGAGRHDRTPAAPAPTSASSYAARRSAHDPAPAADQAAGRRPDAPAAVLPQRVPAEPDVPVVPEPPAVEPPAETPELARIATHLRRDDEPAPPQERPEGFDVNAILGAVREVPGVRDASLRRTPAGAHSLRLDLADGADPAEVSRQVARLLQERMGLAAAPQNVPDVPAAPPPPVRRRGTARVPEARTAGAETRAAGGSRTEPARPPQPQTEPPRRRRQAAPQRGRASVDEATPAGATGSPATLGASYSGAQLTTTESAPSRPLDTGGVPGPRVVIDHVQVSTFGLDATVEVRLIAADETATGYATGPAVDGYVLRLCAVAAAAAVDELLRRPDHAERGRCFVEHAAVVPFGNCEVATVVVLLVCDGWVEQLAGSALVAGDPRQAVVRATLAAVNRRLEALLA
ncbi:hypothetical protein OG994_28440 [Micromonospora globbae]|uniref:Uncharacterized protein n=1 Tax=Micromonospora globbae TaxID=1894969 RepID=A0ABZ1S4N6_9ACTN|nr:hypothetical protein [Micromonospora globbae]WTF85680.1 hypothetical protein OH732_29170 [Micromonospora globbae]